MSSDLDLYPSDEPIHEMSFSDFADGMEEAAEHQEIVNNVNASHKKDYDGSRRRYADQVSTSEALRNRRMAWLSEQNGHSGKVA